MSLRVCPSLLQYGGFPCPSVSRAVLQVVSPISVLAQPCVWRGSGSPLCVEDGGGRWWVEPQLKFSSSPPKVVNILIALTLTTLLSKVGQRRRDGAGAVTLLSPLRLRNRRGEQEPLRARWRCLAVLPARALARGRSVLGLM